jgi:hypothetical protein
MEVMTNLTSVYDFYHETMLSPLITSKRALLQFGKTD